MSTDRRKRQVSELSAAQREEFRSLTGRGFDRATAWGLAKGVERGPRRVSTPKGQEVARLEGWEVPSAEEIEELRSTLVAKGAPAALARNVSVMVGAATRGWARCPAHGCRIEVEMPDLDKQLRVLKELLPYYAAKVPERHEVRVAATTVEELAGLTDQELAEIAAGTGG